MAFSESQIAMKSIKTVFANKIYHFANFAP